MRVCIFISTLDKKGGGPSRSVPILAKGLSQIGVEVLLLFIESEDMNLHILEESNVKTIALHSTIKGSDLEKILIENKIDIIHSQSIWLPIYNTICRIARKLDIPYIMTPRGALEPWCLRSVNIWKRYKKKMAMWLYQKNDLQRASLLLATSDMEANNFRALGLSSPIAVIPNGIVMNEYPCRGIDAINNVKKQAIFLSRIVPKKGVEYLLEAWKLLINDFQDWNLIIVGNGDAEYINKLNHIIYDTGLSDSVKILPPAFGNEKYKLYVESSLFVLPTNSENFGMVIAEALSCGVPVITTTGTPWSSLEETHSGWWIELSVENLTATLKKAMNSTREELFDMGQRGAVMVRNSYDYIQVAKRMSEAYNWILEKDKKPDFIQFV